MSKFVHPGSLENFNAWLNWAKTGDGGIPLIEERLVRLDGTEIDIEAAGVMITYQERSALQVAIRDITARKEAEAEREYLLNAEREQRILGETLGEVFLILTSQTSSEAVLDEILQQMQRLISCSTANIALLQEGLLRMVRWREYAPVTDVTAMPYLEQRLTDYPLDVQAVETRQAVVITDTTQEPRWQISKDTPWIRSYVSVPVCLGDRVLGLLRLNSDRVGTFSSEAVERLLPLTHAAAIALENAHLYDQARSELADRQQAERRLRQSRARNRALLDAIPDLIFRATRDGQYLDCQEGKDWGLTLPLPRDIGKNVREVMPKEIAGQTLTCIRQTLDQREPQVFEYQLTLHDDGDPVDYEMRLVESGPNEVLGIVRNISERKQTERRIIRTERLAALGQLAAALAHEMNNPLQAIQSHLDLVLDFPIDPGESEEYLQVARQEIQRLTEVTSQVLNYARPQTTQPQLVSVANLIEQVLALVQKQLEQCNIQIIAELLNVPPVLAAPDKLVQVFLNLVINAIEAMTEGGELRISLFEQNDHVLISFANLGKSIAPADLPHIFEPFYTTKSRGSGLGLWVSHSLIQQHAGSLQAKNMKNQAGVIFTVKLPVASLENQATEKQTAEAEGAS